MPEPPGFVVKNGTNKFVDIHDTGSFIVDIDLDTVADLTPADRHTTVRLKRGIDGIMNKVDQDLLKLGRVSHDAYFRSRHQPYRQPWLQRDHAPHHFAETDMFLLRRR